MLFVPTLQLQLQINLWGFTDSTWALELGLYWYRCAAQKGAEDTGQIKVQKEGGLGHEW